MKQYRALAYLRQLCCLGLNYEIVIPEFLRAVQTVLPSGSNVFTKVDAQLIPSYHILEFVDFQLDELAPAVVSEFFSREHRIRTLNWFREHSVLADWGVFLDKSFYRSDMYNLVYRRYDQHYGLHALVRQSGMPVGWLSLCRSRQ